MRLLQLTTGSGELLDLHPNVTVVQGLDDGSRSLLLRTVAGLARADAGPSTGLLEAHGVLFDLDAQLLALLDLRELDLDPIVRPGDLPTQPLTVDARELRTREEAFAELLTRISLQAEQQSMARDAVAAAAAALEGAHHARREAELGAARRIEQVDELSRRLDERMEERRRLDEELAAVRAERDRAESARLAVEERTADVRQAAQAALARQLELETERDRLAGERDPDVEQALAAARAELDAIEAAVAAERSAAAPAATDEPDAAPADPALQLERVERRLDELAGLLVAVTPEDSASVVEALALLRGGDSVELVPSTEALALAEELDALRVDDGDGGDGEEVSLVEARARLDDARQGLLEAEQAVRNPDLDRDDVIALEDLHADLLDAIDKADRRLSGNRARARVEELRVGEQEVLDRLGFASYAAYVMGSSLLHVDPEKEAALDAARAELSAAEDEWRRVEAAADAALARAALLDRRRGLLEQARRLLDGAPTGDEVVAALRALRVPIVSATDSARRLRDALEHVGLDLGDEDLDHVELGLIAEAWLAEAGEVDARRHAALEEQTTLEAERAALLVATGGPGVVDGSTAAVAPDPEAEREARLTAARSRLSAVEERWLVHHLAEEQLAGLVAALDTALDEARAAAEAAAGAEAEVADAVAAFRPLNERVDALERARQQAEADEQEAAEALRLLQVEAPDLDALDRAIDAAQTQHRDAVTDLEAHTRALEVLDAEGQASAIEIERLQDIVAADGSGTTTEAEELEWYLLARLAAQRSVSIAGSLPLLLDDALRGLEGSEVDHLLGRLERMAEAVQVIIVSEDPLVAAWAGSAGPARAAVVRPGAA